MGELTGIQRGAVCEQYTMYIYIGRPKSTPCGRHNLSSWKPLSISRNYGAPDKITSVFFRCSGVSLLFYDNDILLQTRGPYHRHRSTKSG